MSAVDAKLISQAQHPRMENPSPNAAGRSFRSSAVHYSPANSPQLGSAAPRPTARTARKQLFELIHDGRHCLPIVLEDQNDWGNRGGFKNSELSNDDGLESELDSDWEEHLDQDLRAAALSDDAHGAPQDPPTKRRKTTTEQRASFRQHASPAAPGPDAACMPTALPDGTSSTEGEGGLQLQSALQPGLRLQHPVVDPVLIDMTGAGDERQPALPAGERSTEWHTFAAMRKLCVFKGRFNTAAWGSSALSAKGGSSAQGERRVRTAASTARQLPVIMAEGAEGAEVAAGADGAGGAPVQVPSVLQSQALVAETTLFNLKFDDPDPALALAADATGCLPPDRRLAFILVGDGMRLFEGAIDCCPEHFQGQPTALAECIGAKLVALIAQVGGPETVAAVLAPRSAAMTAAWRSVTTVFPGILCTSCAPALEPAFFYHICSLPWVGALLAEATELSVLLGILELPRRTVFSPQHLAALEEAAAADLFKETTEKRGVLLHRLLELQPVLRRLTATPQWAGLCGTGKEAKQWRLRLKRLITESDFFQRAEAFVRWDFARLRFARFLLWNYV
jgi:hypothetical protein